MAGRSLLVASLAALLALGCNRTPDIAQLSDLAAAAPPLLAQVGSGNIPKAAWPAGLARLNPKRVRAAPEGLYVVLSSTGVEERGLFVPRAAGFAGVIVSGELHVTDDGQPPAVPRVGSYAYGPAKLPHSASCVSKAPCVLAIAFEAPVDAVAGAPGE